MCGQRKYLAGKRRATSSKQRRDRVSRVSRVQRFPLSLPPPRSCHNNVDMRKYISPRHPPRPPRSTRDCMHRKPSERDAVSSLTSSAASRTRDVQRGDLRLNGRSRENELN